MRLIDADAFLERIQNDTSLCAEIKLYGLNVLKKYLDLQPTAYDIDKVVKELYEERTEILLSNDYECKIINYCIDNFDKAIEIIKQGGVSDMCEWKRYPSNWFVGCDGCKVKHKQGNYCPRCGKKIKVVE